MGKGVKGRIGPIAAIAVTNPTRRRGLLQRFSQRTDWGRHQRLASSSDGIPRMERISDINHTGSGCAPTEKPRRDEARFPHPRALQQQVTDDARSRRVRFRSVIRAGFFAVGVVLACGGSILFAVDSVTLTAAVSRSRNTVLTSVSSPSGDGRRIVDPPEWLPFTLVGIGGVTILYAIALPRQ